MPSLKSLVGSLLEARTAPLPPDWTSSPGGDALFVLAGNPEVLPELFSAARRRCPADRWTLLVDPESTAPPGFDDIYRLPPSLPARLALALRLRGRKFETCLVPMVGGGGWWLKMLGFLAGARTLVLCPSPYQWHLYTPVSRTLRRPLRPLFRLLLMPVNVLLVFATSAYILGRRRLRTR